MNRHACFHATCYDTNNQASADREVHSALQALWEGSRSDGPCLHPRGAVRPCSLPCQAVRRAAARRRRSPVQCAVGSSTFQYAFVGSNPYYVKLQVTNTRCARRARRAMPAPSSMPPAPHRAECDVSTHAPLAPERRAGRALRAGARALRRGVD